MFGEWSERLPRQFQMSDSIVTSQFALWAILIPWIVGHSVV